MAKQLEQFRESVVKALVMRGWGPSGAKVEVAQSDPGYMEGLHVDGMTADQAAARVIRDALARQTALAASRAA